MIQVVWRYEVKEGERGKFELGHGAVFRMSPQLARRTIGATDARLRAESQVRSAWVRWADDGGAILPMGFRVEARIELPARQVEARIPRGAVKVQDGQAKVEVPGYTLAGKHMVDLGRSVMVQRQDAAGCHLGEAQAHRRRGGAAAGEDDLPAHGAAGGELGIIPGLPRQVVRSDHDSRHPCALPTA